MNLKIKKNSEQHLSCNFSAPCFLSFFVVPVLLSDQEILTCGVMEGHDHLGPAIVHRLITKQIIIIIIIIIFT